MNTITQDGRTLYTDRHCPLRAEAPHNAYRNMAFQDARSLVSHFVDMAMQCPKMVFCMAWGKINGVSVDPVAFICADDHGCSVSFINRGGEDFDLCRSGTDDWADRYAVDLTGNRLGLEKRNNLLFFPDGADLKERVSTRIFGQYC